MSEYAQAKVMLGYIHLPPGAPFLVVINLSELSPVPRNLPKGSLLNVKYVRTENWPLVGYTSPFSLILLYLFTVLWFGPWLMSFRKHAFDLRNFMIIYNAFLVLLNGYIVQKLIKSALALNYNIFCQRISYSNDPLETQIASGLWYYYVSKLIEFTDTIVFILRKKKSQLTFLHIYHHITMPIWCWIAVRWYASGSTFFIPTMNSVVHCIMYAYYGASALGIRFIQKRWLTVLQMVQFFTGIIYGISLLYRGCIFIPKPLIYLGLVYGATIILLFINFYREAYTRKARKIRSA